MATVQCAQSPALGSPSIGLMAPEQTQDSSTPILSAAPAHPQLRDIVHLIKAKTGSRSGWAEHHQAELAGWKLTTPSWKHTLKNAAAHILGR